MPCLINWSVAIVERLLLADYTIVKVSDRIEDCSDFDLRPDADPEDAVVTDMVSSNKHSMVNILPSPAMDLTEFGNIHDLASREVARMDLCIYLNLAVFRDKFVRDWNTLMNGYALLNDSVMLHAGCDNVSQSLCLSDLSHSPGGSHVRRD